MAASNTNHIDVTDFVSEHAPFIIEELSNTVYDLDLLKKKGYTVKNGKVFAHAGNMIAPSLEDAFTNLKLKPRTLRPGRIYLTADRRTVSNKHKAVDISGLTFFTDTLSVEEEEK